MILFLSMIMLTASFAQEIQYGIRTGINDNHKKDLDLSAYEIYLHTVPPLYSTDNFLDDLNISLEMALGVVHDKTNSSLLFSIGPTFKLINYGNIVTLSTGLKPSLITNHVFNNFDVGGAFNFKSYIDLTVSLYKHINFGYRFEHISNAGLYRKNPGINFHYIELVYII